MSEFEKIMDTEITEIYDFRLNGFATGFYRQKCSICGRDFLGDKKVLCCLQCDVEVVSSYVDDLEKESKGLEVKLQMSTDRIENLISVLEKYNEHEAEYYRSKYI